MLARRIVPLALAVPALLSTALAADTRVVMREGVEVRDDAPPEVKQAMGGQEPRTVTYWMSGDRAARIDGASKVISRLDRGESWLIDPATETYTVIDLEGAIAPEANDPGSELTRTDDTRTVAGYPAVRYELTTSLGGQPVRADIWVSDAVPVDTAPFRAFIESVASMPSMGWMRRYLELDGYPVRQEFHVGPMISWQEVVEVVDEDPPAGTYEVPAGYSPKE